MDEASAPDRSLPQSPLGDGLRWIFYGLATRGRNVTADDVTQRYARLPNGWGPRAMKDWLTSAAARLSPSTVNSSPFITAATILPGYGSWGKLP